MKLHYLTTKILAAIVIILTINISTQAKNSHFVNMRIYSLYAAHLNGTSFKDKYALPNLVCRKKLSVLYSNLIHVYYNVNGLKQIAYASIPKLGLNKIVLHPLGIYGHLSFMSDQSFSVTRGNIRLQSITFTAPDQLELMFSNNHSLFQCLAGTTAS